MPAGGSDSPASLFPQRAIFPQLEPLLCVTFFTCVGTGIDGATSLEQTYGPVVNYLEEQRQVPYELAWLDNGGSVAVQRDFVSRGAQIEHLLSNPTNEGLFRAVNDVWFRGRACTAPYVLNLEDDRVPHPTPPLPAAVQAEVQLTLLRSVELLRADKLVVGVRLKDEWSDEMVARAMAKPLGRPLPWLTAPSGLQYQRHCMALQSGVVWGSFSMAAVLYDRQRLHDMVGLVTEGAPFDEMPYDYAEGQYAVRVGLAGLCTARPAFPHACDACRGSGGGGGGGGGGERDGACAAGGAADAEACAEPTSVACPPPGTSPCHDLFFETRPPRARDLSDTEWFFWGTPLHVANRSAANAKGGNVKRAEGARAEESARAAPAASSSNAVGVVGCDGELIPREAVAAFNALTHAMDRAKESGDASLAATAMASLEAAIGEPRLVKAFECHGLTQAHVQMLRQHGRRAPGGNAGVNADSGATARAPAQPVEAPQRVAEGNVLLPPSTSWRAVDAGQASDDAPIRRLIIQTHRTREVPQKFGLLIEQVRQLHAGWTYLFFDDADIAAFIAERMPQWKPLYDALTHAPIQRVDLFRYLAVYHYGGFYLDTDVLLTQSLELLVKHSEKASEARCVFPFEREVDGETHPTLLRNVRTSAAVGQYAFGAAPRHPFLAAVLRYVRQATLQPEWAMVPAQAAGDEDDDKTILYTTGPALVTRAFVEGGFVGQVKLLFASALGPQDPLGWGALGRYGRHLHTGSWKKAGELNAQRLVDRAARHRANGNFEKAAGLLMRALLHGGEVLQNEGVATALFNEYVSCYQAAGKPAQALVNLGRQFTQQGMDDAAEGYLEQARELATRLDQPSMVAESHYARWLLQEKRAAATKGADKLSLRESASQALSAAMELQPSVSKYRYAYAASLLSQSTLHAAQAVSELERAVGVELAEAEAEADGIDDAALPYARAHLLFVWSASPELRSAVLASAPLRAQMEKLLQPANALAATPCDLEAGDPAAPTSSSSAASTGSTNGGSFAQRLKIQPPPPRQHKAELAPQPQQPSHSQRLVSLGDGKELRVNSFGVPVISTRS